MNLRKLIPLALLLLTASVAVAQQPAQLLGHWQDSTLVGSFAYNNTYNEVWGIVHQGREYAVIGSTAGTHFIDVTDPAQPQEVTFVPGKTQGGVIIHRDYHDHQGYLYAVADEGASSLQIMDYSTLPDSVHIVYDDDALIRRAHNIFIDTATHRLYALAIRNSSAFYPMTIYDISNPVQPVFLGGYNNFGNGNIGHVHDAYVQNDTAFLNCGYDGLYIVDFADPSSPVLLGNMDTYPSQGYNHSGWIAPSGDYYYLGDENHNLPVKVVRITDMTDLQVVATLDAGASHSFSIPHNIIAKGNQLFVSYYYDGLQVYDVTDPTQPVRTFYYDTYTGPDRNSYEGAWGVYPFLPSGRILLSDMQSGLFVFEAGATTSSREHGIVGLSASAFPAPFAERLTVQLSAQAGHTLDLKLYNLAGQLVKYCGQVQLQADTHVTHLNGLGALPAGYYVLQLQDIDTGAQHSLRILKGR